MDKKTMFSPGMVCRALDNEGEFVTIMHTGTWLGFNVIYYVTGNQGKTKKRRRKNNCLRCSEADFLKMYTSQW